MSDEQYLSFLNKANEGLSQIEQGEDKNKQLRLKNLDGNVEVPATLLEAVKETYYISEADEPFELVALNIGERGMPDKDSFLNLVNHPSPTDIEVRMMDTYQWDPHGNYEVLIHAVEESVGSNDLRVFEIVLSPTKKEYWLVGVKDGFMLGAKALAIET